MDKASIKEFLDILDRDRVRMNVSGDWVMCDCPFSSKTHQSGTDEDPSFGIKVNPGGTSGYNCFGCHKQGGSLVKLINELSRDLDADLGPAFDYILNHETDDTVEFKDPSSDLLGMQNQDSPSLENEGVDTKRTNHFTLDPDDMPEMPEKAREQYGDFKDEIHPYMLDRGFTRETCYDWGVKLEESWTGSERVVLPVFDYDNNPIAFTRRPVWDEPTCQMCGHSGDGVKWHGSECPNCNYDFGSWFIWPKYQHSKGFKRNYYLYGEHLIDETCDTGVVVEGNLDALWLYQLGVKNVVATLGSKIGKNEPGQQMYRMGVHFDKVVVLADGDEAGRDMASQIEEFYQAYPHKLSVFTIVCPEGKDPDDLSKKEIAKRLESFGVGV